MWQRSDYDAAAQKIGKDFAENRGNSTVSINQLATKVARDNNLNPEGIRTMVRLANVSVFEEIFQKHAGNDKMFEFEVGDPEVVINTLYQETKTAMDKVAGDSSAPYSREADYFGDVPSSEVTPKTTRIFEEFEAVERNPEMEKAANNIHELYRGLVAGFVDVVPAFNPISALEVRQQMSNAQEKLAMEKREHEFEWVDTLEKTAKLFNVASLSDSEGICLEKDAVSLLGEDAIPDIAALRTMTGRCTKYALLGGSSVQEVTNRHVSNPTAETRGIIQMLKTARDTRNEMHVCTKGIEWITNNIERIK
jgi:hypothetical protein